MWNANKTWRQIKDNVSAPGVGSMPNVAITSPDGSINVGEATVDPVTVLTPLKKSPYKTDAIHTKRNHLVLTPLKKSPYKTYF